jgi:hypothetical protein
MTREEKLAILKDIIDGEIINPQVRKDVGEWAIKALEQESQTFKWCTDCKEYDQEKHCCHRYSKVIKDTVAEIRQELKTGHWVGIDEYPHEDYECDNCGFIHTFIDGHTAQYNYCPNCGAKMVEPQESEG